MISSKFKNYINLILIFILIILITAFLMRILFSYAQDKILYIMESKKFEQYLIIKINEKLSMLANSDLSESEKLFYKDVFKKIYVKFTPIIDDAINEIKINKK
jgi:hypothetical protein